MSFICSQIYIFINIFINIHIPLHKDVDWPHSRCYMREHKSAQCYWRTISEQQQTVHLYIYIYIYLYIYTNLPVNVIVRLPHPRSRDSQGQEQTIRIEWESFNVRQKLDGLFVLGVIHISNLPTVCVKLTQVGGWV